MPWLFSNLSWGPSKPGNIVAETFVLMRFPCARILGNICCGHNIFLNKIRNIFCVPDTKFVSATYVVRAGKRENICVDNNVSATMCPRLPGPLCYFWLCFSWKILYFLALSHLALSVTFHFLCVSFTFVSISVFCFILFFLGRCC